MARSCAVEKSKGLPLDMGEYVAPHIGFDARSEKVSEVGYKILRARTHYIQSDHTGDKNIKRAEVGRSQKAVYAVACEHGKRQIGGCDKGGAQ